MMTRPHEPVRDDPNVKTKTGEALGAIALTALMAVIDPHIRKLGIPTTSNN